MESLVEREVETRERIKDEIALLIHDLRRFSNSLYQNAVATKKAIYDGNAEEARTRIENTLAAQAMLSIRTDILDLTESVGIQLNAERVPVYRKFDKVVKSFQPGASLESINLQIKGSSHSLALGPDCAEIIAYILIDNALKYSPRNHQIDVAVTEQDADIIVRVSSLGPVIELDEIDYVFQKGFRSRSAKLVETSGTGFGLYLAKSLVDRFDGKISVTQNGEKIKTNRAVYQDISFIVMFPISEKKFAPTHVHSERKGPAKDLPPRKKNQKHRSGRNRWTKKSKSTDHKTSER